MTTKISALRDLFLDGLIVIGRYIIRILGINLLLVLCILILFLLIILSPIYTWSISSSGIKNLLAEILEVVDDYIKGEYDDYDDDDYGMKGEKDDYNSES